MGLAGVRDAENGGLTEVLWSRVWCRGRQSGRGRVVVGQPSVFCPELVLVEGLVKVYVIEVFDNSTYCETQ